MFGMLVGLCLIVRTHDILQITMLNLLNKTTPISSAFQLKHQFNCITLE